MTVRECDDGTLVSMYPVLCDETIITLDSLSEDETTIYLDTVSIFVMSRDFSLVAAWKLSDEYLDRWFSEVLPSILFSFVG